MAPVAVAAPVTVEEFRAQFVEAITVSGVFAPGTTLTWQGTNVQLEGFAANSSQEIVNPDGSLTHYRDEAGDVERVTCVRVDRCWRQQRSVYGNAKWHLLPAGTVNYENGTPSMVMPDGIVDTAGATFDVADVPDVGRVFTMAVQGAIDSVLVTWTFLGPSVTMVVSSTYDQGVTREIVRESLRAQPEPVPVAAPIKRSIGVPASTRVVNGLGVVINH